MQRWTGLSLGHRGVHRLPRRGTEPGRHRLTLAHRAGVRRRPVAPRRRHPLGRARAAPGRGLVLAVPAVALGAPRAVRGHRVPGLDRSVRARSSGVSRWCSCGSCSDAWTWPRCHGWPSPWHGRSAPRCSGSRARAASTWRPRSLAATLLLASLILAVDRRWPLLAGLLLGAAAAARLPVGLAFPLLLYLYGRDGWWRVLVGLAIPALLVAGYNAARFGDPLEFGYGMIRDVDGNSVLDESWYPHGIDSVWYIPQGLVTMLLKGLDWQDGVALGAARLGRHVGAADDAHPLVGRGGSWSAGPRHGHLRRAGAAARPGPRQPGLRAGRLPVHRRRVAAALDPAGHHLPGRPDDGLPALRWRPAARSPSGCAASSGWATRTDAQGTGPAPSHHR